MNGVFVVQRLALRFAGPHFIYLRYFVGSHDQVLAIIAKRYSLVQTLARDLRANWAYRLARIVDLQYLGEFI